MDSGLGDEEDAVLVPRQRAFLGMKFHDEESHRTARNVSIASLSLGIMVVFHFIWHLMKSGRLFHGIWHLLIGMVLPLIGYRGASLADESPWRPRMLWLFHIGNVIFVLVHAVVFVVVLSQVFALEQASVDSMCNSRKSDDPWLRPADHHGPTVLPTLPPEAEGYDACREDVLAEKANATSLMAMWLFISLPYWLCAGYAAYMSHELYFQLRIRELSIRRGGHEAVDNDDQLATVEWRQQEDPTVE